MIKNHRGPTCGCDNPAWRPTPGLTGRNDPGDPDRPFGLPAPPGVQRLELDGEDRLIARRSKRRKNRKRSRKKRGRTTRLLYLHDGNEKLAGEKLLAQEIFKASPGNMVGISDWDKLAKAINSRSSIDHLVLSFHGYEGGLIVGGDSRFVDEKSVTSLFASKTGAKPPSIKKISFVGCNVGGRPAKMARFAALFGAEEVSGYTWYMARQEITITIYPENSVSDITRALKPYSEFVRPKPNVSAIKARTRRRQRPVELLLMYGAREYTTIDSFPLSFGQKRNFKPIEDATQTEVTAKEAQKLEKTFDSSPVTAFQKVTVKLK